MCIERNRDILFWVRAKSRVSRYVRNCGGMQLVLPNPTTVAIPAAAGLVHCGISWFVGFMRSFRVGFSTLFEIPSGRGLFR